MIELTPVDTLTVKIEAPGFNRTVEANQAIAHLPNLAQMGTVRVYFNADRESAFHYKYGQKMGHEIVCAAEDMAGMSIVEAKNNRRDNAYIEIGG